MGYRDRDSVGWRINSREMMEYSVIIPVYNSSESLRELCGRTHSTLKKMTNDFEIILVDDYSSDGSWNELAKLKTEFSENVKIVRLAKNYGQHNAIFCGFKYATGEYVITIDDDLQNHPEDIVVLIEEIKNTNLDLVYGIDKSNKNAPIRKASGDVWKKISKNLEGGLGEGSSFRIFNSSLLNKIMNHNQHFIFLDELLFWYTNFIGFVPVKRVPRKYGATGYSPFIMFKFISSITVFYGTWPLKLMTYGGAFISAISFLIGSFFLWKKFYLGANVPGFTGIIVAISFSTSVILISFGIIGKYLNNIYVVLNNKPTYSVKEAQL
jgi:undecaprenyl-phosphate 4-deoxy-4-formamido-L-arabinose transferase